jgi:hypothetical protein
MFFTVQQVCLFVHCIQTYALLFSIFGLFDKTLRVSFSCHLCLFSLKNTLQVILDFSLLFKKCWNIVCFLLSVIECGFKQHLFCSLPIHSVLFCLCKCDVYVSKSVPCMYSFYSVLQIIALSVLPPESVSSFLYYHLILQCSKLVRGIK